MPFYEYECSNCKFYSEVMQKISDAPLTKCPSCGKKTMVKLVSAPNFRLKGGGWYETDFKGDKENKRNLAGADRDESAKSEAPSAAKSDSTAKTEGPKTEGAKTETASSDSAASKPATTASTGSGGESKASSGRRSGASSKPASRAPAGKVKVAASKAKPAPSRSKAKPAAKKKARR
jgi:putative FmdB family regulatory protein